MPARTALLAVALLVVAVGCGGGGDGELSSDDEGVIDQIRNAGGDPTRPRPVDYYLYFVSRTEADRAAEQLESDGFGVTVDRSEAEDAEWLVLATKTTVLTTELARTQERINAIARMHDGEYDGWDAPATP